MLDLASKRRPVFSRRGLEWAGTLLVFFAPWVLLVGHLSAFWSIDPQYSYGWAVPFLTLFFFWQQWRSGQPQLNQDGRRAATLVAVVIAILLGPVWLIQEAVPDWSVVNWVFALAIAVYQLSLIASISGKSMAKHFLFPITFILCAVPWPQRLELALVQGLMKSVASVSAEILTWSDIPALATGNIIRLPSGPVGIDEACSGVRSLQSMLMASLFLGELLRMKLWRRLLLIIAGLFLALFFNLVRTVVLVWIANSYGRPALERWHDPAGFSVLTLSLVILWIIAQIRQKRSQVETSSRDQLMPLTIPLIAGFSSWILFFVVGTEIWYRRNESDRSNTQYLSVQWPPNVSGLSKFTIPASARRILLCDDARCASWQDQSGVRWSFYALVWNSGRTSTQSARIHRPENCLQGSGAILLAQVDETVVKIGDTPLAFHTYLFERNNLPLYVFYLLWEEGNRDLNASSSLQDWSGISRLQRVWLGQRNLGQQSLEIVLEGATSIEQARTTLKKGLGEIVRISPHFSHFNSSYRNLKCCLLLNSPRRPVTTVFSGFGQIGCRGVLI